MSRYESDGPPEDVDWDQPRWQFWHRRGGAKSSLRMRIGAVLASVVALALVCGALVAYAEFRGIWDSIHKVDVSKDLPAASRPKEDPKVQNILLIGSDSRKGKNGSIGGRDGIEGQRSDTVMILHVSPGAKRAVILSFPRDTVVPMYNCSKEEGGAFPGQEAEEGAVEQLNSTFSNGGPGCLWKTIEKQTHIYINHFVELTFEGFEKVINRLGGVEVCLPAAVDDPMSGLRLKAGKHHVYGREALAFWRTREDLGEGSDLQRIERDQYLMASLIQGIKKKNLLAKPTHLLKIISAVSHNLSTDIDSAATMLHLAESLRGLNAGKVQMIEVPTIAYPSNEDWVELSSRDHGLFSAVARDKKLPSKHKHKTSPSASASASEQATLDALSPSQIKVEVLNGSGASGLAGEGEADLTNVGFDVLGSGNASNFDYTKSVLEYDGPVGKQAAQKVAQYLDNVELLRTPGITPGTVDLILGSDFTELKTPTTSTASPGTAGLTKKYGGVTGKVNICHDNAAFSGPDGD